MIGKKTVVKKLPGTVDFTALGKQAVAADRDRQAGDYARVVNRLLVGGYLDPDEAASALAAKAGVASEVMALCPLHESIGEHEPSLHVTRKVGGSVDGGVKLKCFGGCDQQDVWETVGLGGEDDPLPRCKATRKASDGLYGGRLLALLELRDTGRPEDDLEYFRWCAQEGSEDPDVAKEVATYLYRDAGGREVAAKVRWESRKGKTFRWFHRGDGGRWWVRGAPKADVPLYRTDEVVAAGKSGSGREREVVWVVEGEKDADRLAAAGLLVTSIKGPKLLRQAIERLGLAGRRAVVVPDDDPEGMSFARTWARLAREAGADVNVLEPLTVEGRKRGHGTDVSDWLDAGGVIEQLIALAPTPVVETEEAAEAAEAAEAVDAVDAVDAEDFEERQRFEQRVANEMFRLTAAAEARRRITAAIWEPPPPDLGYTLAQARAKKHVARRFYIEKVFAERHTVTLAGKAKSGKTTLCGNVIRSLVDRTPLLGTLESAGLLDGGRVGTWNCEMDPQDFDEYLLAMGISDSGMGQVAIQHLQGYSMNLLSDLGKEWAVKWLLRNEIEIWIPDPWSKLCSWAGVDENDNTATKKLQGALDEIKREARIKSMFIVTHPPRSADGSDGTEARTRGAAANDEWPDALWSYSRDGDQRYLKIQGRNRVGLDETALEFDALTNLLSGRGGNRSEVRKSELDERVRQVIEEAEDDGINSTALYDEMGGNRNDVSSAAKRLAKRGLVYSEKSGRQTIWRAGAGAPAWPAAGIGGADSGPLRAV